MSPLPQQLTASQHDVQASEAAMKDWGSIEFRLEELSKPTPPTPMGHCGGCNGCSGCSHITD